MLKHHADAALCIVMLKRARLPTPRCSFAARFRPASTGETIHVDCGYNSWDLVATEVHTTQEPNE